MEWSYKRGHVAKGDEKRRGLSEKIENGAYDSEQILLAIKAQLWTHR